MDFCAELHEIGIDGSISKPFPTTGRTLAVVIGEVMEKHRRFRLAAKANGQEQPLTKFSGGVLGYWPHRVEMCGEVIASEDQKGYGWRLLHLLRDKNERGKHIRMQSKSLAAKLGPNVSQNTLIHAINALRGRITTVMKDRLGYDCGPEHVIANGGRGYHFRDWIIVEQYDDVGTLASAPGDDGVAKLLPAKPSGPSQPQLSDRQQWVLTQLATDVPLTRQDFERQFGVSDRTAQRELGQLCDWGLVEFDRSQPPGSYRLKQ